jgi:hypothetical protein
VKKAQVLGFSLEDIKQVLDLGRSGRAPCSTVLALAQSHLAEVDRRIEQLRQLRDQLDAAVRRRQSDCTPPDCASTFCGLISDAVDLSEPVPSQNTPTSFRPARTARSVSGSDRESEFEV